MSVDRVAWERMLLLVRFHRGFGAWTQIPIRRSRISRRAGAAKVEQALLQAADRAARGELPCASRPAYRGPQASGPGGVANDAVSCESLAFLGKVITAFRVTGPNTPSIWSKPSAFIMTKIVWARRTSSARADLEAGDRC